VYVVHVAEIISGYKILTENMNGTGKVGDVDFDKKVT
jgi:hypothetical protein